MKKFIIILLSLLFVLCAYGTESFNKLSVEVPCTIKFLQSDSFRVRVLDNKGKVNTNVTWEIKDSTLNISGESFDESETLILIYSPVDEKIIVDKERFTLKEKEV